MSWAISGIARVWTLLFHGTAVGTSVQLDSKRFVVDRVPMAAEPTLRVLHAGELPGLQAAILFMRICANEQKII